MLKLTRQDYSAPEMETLDIIALDVITESFPEPEPPTETPNAPWLPID